MQQDIQLLKDVGANYVRGAHYPQDQRFLDLCDEVGGLVGCAPEAGAASPVAQNGIVIWEETLGPGVSVQNLQDPYFMKYQVWLRRLSATS